MEEAGADTRAVSGFLAAMGGGQHPLAALRSAQAPAAAAEFVSSTWTVLTEAPIHCQAAAFAFAREDLIPQMFQLVLKTDEDEGRLGTFREYLDRHISLDGEDHMPMAMAMVAEICGDDHAKWDACARTVTASIKARTRMWDGVVVALHSTEGAELGQITALAEPVGCEPSAESGGWLVRRRLRRDGR
jgi:hypothetical protein